MTTFDNFSVMLNLFNISCIINYNFILNIIYPC